MALQMLVSGAFDTDGRGSGKAAQKRLMLEDERGVDTDQVKK